MSWPRSRTLRRLLLPAAILLGVGCVGPTGRPPVPPSSASVQAELGERDVIQAGEEYARNNSFVLAQAGEAVEIRPNLWRIRFGLKDKPGRGVELEFDEIARRVTRAQEIEILPGSTTTPDNVPGRGEDVPSGGQGRGPVP
ncbi:hypothetical protein HUA74_34005 [Myxococcus sp. CA051A]|uniref:hypothetical protein n=1 Tax=Myxococcus TaxID=32 RepID=UPI00157B8441|nr:MULTISPECIES: hypothetical protein [Myxococcus]NTX03361.1 hypothetical protein [Myxococcus sp. CA040A]NTX11771.1 hypothetical protein [Myxococcus sp. CA056]NTX65687.1 hypothetical protein [Myxococcus sp. CA051A]